MISEATTSLGASPESNDGSDLKEAYELLGVGPDADAQTVEAAYWRLAKQFALRRRSDAFAGCAESGLVRLVTTSFSPHDARY